MKSRTLVIGICVAVLFLLIFVLTYSHFFGPVNVYGEQKEFIVKEDQTVDEVANGLKEQGFIKSRTAFEFAFKGIYKGEKVRPGGYELSSSMDVWSVASSLSKPPYLVWLSFPPGWRKEQIADRLTALLGWTADQKSEWLRVDTAPSNSFVEGVYYPDTYLIPSDQTPAQVAARLRDRFQEVFAPYANEAAQKNMSWSDVVTLASLLEREAAGPQDMPLIAGIMWNRIDRNMPLQIDATLQYIKGTEANWWPVPTGSDKSIESPFNTYKHAGLPPHAIAEPSLVAIQAVLNPEKTSCLFYLHSEGQIHCSATYQGQLSNVNKYLK